MDIDAEIDAEIDIETDISALTQRASHPTAVTANRMAEQEQNVTVGEN